MCIKAQPSFTSIRIKLFFLGLVYINIIKVTGKVFPSMTDSCVLKIAIKKLSFNDIRKVQCLFFSMSCETLAFAQLVIELYFAGPN